MDYVDFFKLNFNNVRLESSAGISSGLPADDLVEVVFSGKSNVGKSSAINKVINRKSFARISGSPGKTITINFYNIGSIRLVDLPGYGYAKRSFSEKKRWSKLVQDYFSNRKNIALVVQVIDIRHHPTSEDFQMIDYLFNLKIPFVVLLNKIDKLNSGQREDRLSKINSELNHEGVNIIPFSSKTGENVEVLRKVIYDSTRK